MTTTSRIISWIFALGNAAILAHNVFNVFFGDGLTLISLLIIAVSAAGMIVNAGNLIWDGRHDNAN